MKATGIVRRVDNQRRIVIPKEICRTHESGNEIRMRKCWMNAATNHRILEAVFCLALMSWG